MKHIYMLGAGASNDAGVPLGKELVWNYYQDCAGVSELDENNKRTDRECREKFEKFGSFGEFLKVADDYFDLGEYCKWVKAVKSKYGYIHPASWGNKEYYIDEVLGIFGEKKDGNSISLVKRLIVEHITEKTSRENGLYYCKFIERLPNNSVLMTTNFDSCLVTIEKNGAQKKTHFDCSVDFDFVDPNARDFYYKKGGQKLIKLNGSLDWLMYNKCEKLGLFVPCRDYGSQRCSMTDNCGSQLEPYIVLPHVGYDDRMKKLWDIAGEELQKAAHVTIIGYSFPEYDKEIANLFKDKTNEKAQVQIYKCA